MLPLKNHVKLDGDGRLVPTKLDSLPSSDDCAQLVSDVNYSLVEDLITSLSEAREASGLEPLDVAKVLGVPTEMISEIESGEYDLSLDELREFLYAIDAIGSFKIIPNARKTIYDVLVKSASTSARNMWVKHGNFTTVEKRVLGGVAKPLRGGSIANSGI